MYCKGSALCGVLTALIFVSGCASNDTGAQDAAAQDPQENAVLTIGIDDSYEPYSYVDENGDYAGLDIELAREACSRMGREAVFTAIKWDNKNAYLEDGSIDCVWSCFSMDGRENDYEWVGPYMYSRQVLAVREDSGIYDLDELNGRDVAVMSSTKPESILLEKSTDAVPDVGHVYCMENMDLVFSALESGYVDAAAGHETVMRQYMDTMPDHYRLLSDALQAVQVGIAFEKDTTDEVVEELRDALASMEEDGTLQEILERYEISVDKVAYDETAGLDTSKRIGGAMR